MKFEIDCTNNTISILEPTSLRDLDKFMKEHNFYSFSLTTQENNSFVYGEMEPLIYTTSKT